jgi:rubredoxin
MRYQCSACAHIYDEAIEGTPWSELPDDWACPICGVEKEYFEPLSGHDDVHALSVSDLRTTSSEIANHTPIAHVGEPEETG